MNRVLPVYFLAALLIHGAVLWAWARTPPALIGMQEPPALEIEISEEQNHSTSTDTVKEESQHEVPPHPTEKPTDPETKPEPKPEEMGPEPLPIPAAKPTPRPNASKPRSSRPPAVSQARVASSPSASRPPAGSGKDQSHASWKHRVTPSYPASALLSRKSGRVLVTVQINALGQATAAAVTTSSANPILDAAAMRAARESSYHPKCLLGVPLPDTVAIPYNFDIRER